MSSEGKGKLVLFLCAVTFTGVLRTCGSTRATKQTVSDGFKTNRRGRIVNKTMEGEDSSKDVRFGWPALGRNFQIKYSSYGAIKVDGLRGNSLAPQTSVLNISSSQILKAQDNSSRINDRTEQYLLDGEGNHSRKNESVNGGDSPPLSDTHGFNVNESSLHFSRNSKWNNDTGAVKSKMESLSNDSGYQSDMSQQADVAGNLLVSAEGIVLPTKHILQAAESKPLILCEPESMTLVAKKSEYDYLKVDGVNDAPLYLSELPSSCGHTFKMTSHNLVLKTSYDGCFIIKKGDKYIMPLLWWESPVNMSCPATVTPTPFPPPPPPFPFIHPFHPPVICSPFGMNLKVSGGLNAAERLKVELSGKKVPFLSSQCGSHVIGDLGQPIIHVPYGACGMKMMDGMHVLTLFSGKIEKIFTCHLSPISSPPLYHSVVPIYSYYSPPSAQQVPPLTAPVYPPVPGSYNYDPHLYTHPPIVLPDKIPRPAPTKHTGLPSGYHPYSSVNPDVPLHPSAGGSFLPLLIPPFNSNLRMLQMVVPVCTPSGPLPCISPFPFYRHRGSLSSPLPYQPHDLRSLPHHHYDPLSPSLSHPHHDPLSPLPHHDPLSPLPPYPHHDPLSPLPPYPHHDPLSPLPPYPHHDPLSPLPPHPYHDPLSPLPPHPHHDLLSPLPPHPHHDLLSPLPPHPHHDLLSPLPPHPHHDLLSPLPPHPHHDPLSPLPPHHHHDPLSPLPPHHHHDPLSPLPPHPHHDPLSPLPPHHHHDPLSSLPPHHHHDPLSPLPPHHHHDPLSLPFPPHHDPLSPFPPHHDPLSPLPPHHHHDPLSPFPPHHHHDPLSPFPPHHDPLSPLPPHHHHDPFSPFPHYHHVTGNPPSFGALPPSPTPSLPFLNCTTSQMSVTLPSAVPGTIQVKGPDNEWWPITSVPGCSFHLEAMGVKGVIVSSPLHPCHAYTLSPSVITLSIKFTDVYLGRLRILELQCPYYLPTSTSPTAYPGPAPQLQVFCSENSMSVELLPGAEYALRVHGTQTGQSGAHCRHFVTKGEHGRNVLVVPFSSCHVSVLGNERKIIIKFRTLSGLEGEVPLSCLITSPIMKKGCEISKDLQLPCELGLVSSADCQSLGCCYNTQTHACYYPLDECTPDRHMVFTVPASLTDPPLSTSSLFTPGKNACFPEKVTPSLALFKIPLDGCGVHKYEVGETKIYMIEILNTLYAIKLNYGTITRDSPVRLIVECRYSPSAHVSVAYLVKTPSLGPSIQAQGVFGVQLRIAKDDTYTDYYPQYHRPLGRLLGLPLYLEVRLLHPPDDNVVLLVHYCLAYPRSAQAAWVLNYDGCPNQLDNTGHLPTSAPSPLSQTRRFTIRTFQFLSSDMSYSEEEIYFMCSTEICSELDGPCVEGCIHFPSSSEMRTIIPGDPDGKHCSKQTAACCC